MKLLAKDKFQRHKLTPYVVGGADLYYDKQRLFGEFHYNIKNISQLVKGLNIL